MFGSSARFALRMRVSMSEIGSTIKLPACFRHSRDQSSSAASRNVRREQLNLRI